MRQFNRTLIASECNGLLMWFEYVWVNQSAVKINRNELSKRNLLATVDIWHSGVLCAVFIWRNSAFKWRCVRLAHCRSKNDQRYKFQCESESNIFHHGAHRWDSLVNPDGKLLFSSSSFVLFPSSPIRLQLCFHLKAVNQFIKSIFHQRSHIHLIFVTFGQHFTPTNLMTNSCVLFSFNRYDF